MVILVPAVLEVRRRAGRGWERGERARGYDVSEGLYESLVSGTSVDGSEVDLVPARASERVPVHGHRRNVTAGRGDTQLVAGRGLRAVDEPGDLDEVCAVRGRAARGGGRWSSLYRTGAGDTAKPGCANHRLRVNRLRPAHVSSVIELTGSGVGARHGAVHGPATRAAVQPVCSVLTVSLTDGLEQRRVALLRSGRSDHTTELISSGNLHI